MTSYHMLLPLYFPMLGCASSETSSPNRPFYIKFPVVNILPQSKVENREDKSLFLKGERSPEGTRSKCRSKGTIQPVLTDSLGKRIRVSWPLFIFLLQGHQLIPNSGTCWLGRGSHTPLLEIWSGQCKARPSSSAQT